MIKKHLLFAGFFAVLSPLLMWNSPLFAAEFSRDEIAIMHEAGIRMALPNEGKPYVIPQNINPARLLATELLDFSNSKLYALPLWLKRFKNLRKLDLSHTAISIKGLPETLAGMTQLEFLNLSGNPLFKQQSGASLATIDIQVLNFQKSMKKSLF